MNTKNIFAVALLAGLALVSRADVVDNIGDLTLAFRGTGVSNDLAVSLGAASTFETYTPGVHTIYAGGGALGLDLVSGFGATWNSNATTNVKWGVFGSVLAGAGPVNGSADDTLWSTVKTAQGGLSRASAGIQDNPSGTIGGWAYGTVNGAGSTANNTQATLQSNAAGAGGYTDNITTGGTLNFGPFFGYFNANIENTTLGTSNRLDLYKLAPGSGTGTLLGFFTLGNDSSLTFTVPAAIPEPSTYAAILGVATLGFAAIRRRKQALVA